MEISKAKKKKKNHTLLYRKIICYALSLPPGRNYVTSASLAVLSVSSLEQYQIILTSVRTDKKSLYCVLPFGKVWCQCALWDCISWRLTTFSFCTTTWKYLLIYSTEHLSSCTEFYFLLCQSAHHILRTKLFDINNEHLKHKNQGNNHSSQRTMWVCGRKTAKQFSSRVWTRK